MNITCAYCHIKGHHIKFCGELAEKNRRLGKHTTVQKAPIVFAEQTKPPKKQTNIFVDLYSSEEEEGEIVEDRILRRPASSFSASASVSASSEEDQDQIQEKSWSRSGIKGIVVPMPQVKYSSESSDSDFEFNEERLTKNLAALSAFVSKYKGMRWSDIESDEE